jgi:hypothetical protein
MDNTVNVSVRETEQTMLYFLKYVHWRNRMDNAVLSKMCPLEKQNTFQNVSFGETEWTMLYFPKCVLWRNRMDNTVLPKMWPLEKQNGQCCYFPKCVILETECTILNYYRINPLKTEVPLL